jgi:hypothetical protein
MPNMPYQCYNGNCYDYNHLITTHTHNLKHCRVLCEAHNQQSAPALCSYCIIRTFSISNINIVDANS